MTAKEYYQEYFDQEEDKLDIVKAIQYVLDKENQSHKVEVDEFKKKVRKAMTCFNNEPENWHGGMDILNEIYKTP